MYLCLDHRLTFDVNVIEILTLVGKHEVRHHFLNLKWTTTLIPAHYGSGRRIQILASGVIQVRPGTISGVVGVGGGGGGGGCCPLQTQYEKWGSFNCFA